MIDEDTLQMLIPAFYAKVRTDPVLGPIFNGAIDDWPQHLDKLRAFWSSVMLGSGRYKGQPMPAHIKHMDEITPATFTRWLRIWGETTDALLDPVAATAMQEKAAKIAESLSLGIAFQRDRSGRPQRPTTAPRAEEEEQDFCPNPETLPDGLAAYKRTAEFTPETVPAGLKTDHCTKAGVWGLIHVTAGRLRYRITDTRRPTFEVILVSGATPAIVEPTILHHVEPLGEARFFVEFWR